MEPCSIYADSNLIQDPGMDDVNSWEGNGATLSLFQPSYHSENAILISGRSKRWQGIGQRLEGELLTASGYSGKLFLKLVESPTETKSIDLTLQVTKKSDSSNSYNTIATVAFDSAENWEEMKFSFNPSDYISGYDSNLTLDGVPIIFSFAGTSFIRKWHPKSAVSGLSVLDTAAPRYIIPWHPEE